VEQALEAAKNLEEDDQISVAVINARFVKPLDKELILRLARDVGRIVTIEENAVHGGFGSAVLELLQANSVDNAIVRCIGIPDKYIEHGAQSILRHKCGLDAEGIEQVARRLMSL
jgi:1-deoxy-D-xylulose-5-phosphate synthase